MNFIGRILYLIIGIILFGSWLYMDDRLKGVVFFWAFPIIGLLLICVAIFAGSDKTNEKK